MILARGTYSRHVNAMNGGAVGISQHLQRSIDCAMNTNCGTNPNEVATTVGIQSTPVLHELASTQRSGDAFYSSEAGCFMPVPAIPSAKVPVSTTVLKRIMEIWSGVRRSMAIDAVIALLKRRGMTEPLEGQTPMESTVTLNWARLCKALLELAETGGPEGEAVATLVRLLDCARPHQSYRDMIQGSGRSDGTGVDDVRQAAGKLLEALENYLICATEVPPKDCTKTLMDLNEATDNANQAPMPRR